MSRLWGYRTPLSEIPKQDMLAELPADLLLSIVNSLSQDDVTCISICCRRLFATFSLRIIPYCRHEQGIFSILKSP